MNFHDHTRPLGDVLAETARELETHRAPRPVYLMAQDRTARQITGADLAEYLDSIDTSTDLGRVLRGRLEHAAARVATLGRDGDDGTMISLDDVAEVWEWATEALMDVATLTTEGARS